MKYKNTKTGAIIETSTKVSGENWDSQRSGNDYIRII